MNYLAKIEKQEAEDGYPNGYFLVTFPSLPGCVTYGETEADARKYATDALDSWLSARCTVSVIHGFVPFPDSCSDNQKCSSPESATEMVSIQPSLEVLKEVIRKQKQVIAFQLFKIIPLFLFIVPLLSIIVAVLLSFALLLCPIEYFVDRVRALNDKVFDASWRIVDSRIRRPAKSEFENISANVQLTVDFEKAIGAAEVA